MKIFSETLLKFGDNFFLSMLSMNACHEIRLCYVEISPKYLAAGSMNDQMQFLTIRTNTWKVVENLFVQIMNENENEKYQKSHEFKSTKKTHEKRAWK